MPGHGRGYRERTPSPVSVGPLARAPTLEGASKSTTATIADQMLATYPEDVGADKP
jgi:hypothetical protein